MYKIMLFLLLLLLPSCENDENSGSTKVRRVSVLIVSYDLSELNEVKKFENQMPNFDFHIRSAAFTDPSLDELNSYDVVLFFSNGSEVRTESIGDSLYNFALSGGKLILADLYSNSEKYYDYNNLELINPVIKSDLSKASDVDSLINNNNTFHTILYGIDSLIIVNGGGSIVKEEMLLLASWNNGDVLASQNKDLSNVLYISAFPAELKYPSVLSLDENFVSIKNFFRLWANAIRFVHENKVLKEDLVYQKLGS